MKKEILDRPLNSLVEGILDSYETVSYTHLDVYKRQTPLSRI